MEIIDAEKLVGASVKVYYPSGRKGFSIAKLISVDDKNAVIKPKGHQKTERVPISRLSLWKKGLHMSSNKSHQALANEKYVLVGYVDGVKNYYSIFRKINVNIDQAKKYDNIGNARKAVGKMKNKHDLRVVSLSSAQDMPFHNHEYKKVREAALQAAQAETAQAETAQAETAQAETARTDRTEILAESVNTSVPEVSGDFDSLMAEYAAQRMSVAFAEGIVLEERRKLVEIEARLEIYRTKATYSSLV